ncbi:hypothetical protein CHS0354_039855 [Potamilus streckersoni]|uniref:Uncharacterized protein n=1 Tax=Potamilus streckersoni TaxID=2493646 RepID=A0AAE0SSG0_9BIVA|nr:hypothetical protein CHS0354_039855 [Potamilus streckersoni]
MELYPGKAQFPPGQPQGYGQPYGYPQQPMYGQPQGYGQPGQPGVVTTQTNVAYITPSTVVVTNNQPPPNGMVLAILACVFCFWPTGIGAIMYASQAKTEVDNNEAWRKYRMSRMFSIISIIVGIIWISIAIWRIVYAVNYTTTVYYYG